MGESQPFNYTVALILLIIAIILVLLLLGGLKGNLETIGDKIQDTLGGIL